MHKFKISIWRHLLQNFKISYAKSFLGDQMDTVVRTVDLMIKRRLPGGVVFENLVMPGDHYWTSETFDQNRSLHILNQTARELIAKCLENNLLMICNYGPHFPDFLAESIIKLANELGLPVPKVVIDSDKILPRLALPVIPYYRFDHQSHSKSIFYKNFQNGRDIADGIQSGAQILFTKNLAYSSLILGATMAHFDWSEMDLNQLASASLVGFLLESDVQSEYFSKRSENVTDSPSDKLATLAIAEFSDDGSCVISKSGAPKGFLNRLIVKKLYEIEGPNALITQDIIADICKLVVEDLGDNHVRIRGTIGHPVSAIQSFEDLVF